MNSAQGIGLTVIKYFSFEQLLASLTTICVQFPPPPLPYLEL